MFLFPKPRYWRSSAIRRPARGLLGAVLLFISPASPGAESLRDALALAMDNVAVTAPGPAGIAPGGAADAMGGSRQWLGGLPTLSASYLASNESNGTDETEISLSFPIKSPLQRRSDATLEQVDPRLDTAARQYRAWYLSGTLRELYARDRLARAELPSAEDAASLLDDIEAQLRQNLSAGSAERYDLVAIQQQRLRVAGRLASLRAEIAGVRRLYASLTGETTLPQVTGDAAELPDRPLYEQHPSLVSLDLERQRDLAALRATSVDATPWNLALVGREIAIPRFTERQFGVAIDVPVSIGAKPSASTLSGERFINRAYQQQRDDQLLSLRDAWETLQAERSALLARRAELADAMDPQTVAELIAQTRTSRELPIELRLQRMLALLEARAQPAMIAAQIDANSAALKQLAGMSL